MAASTTTTTAKISVSSKEPTCFLDNQNQPIKQKRCKAREVTCFLDIQNQPIKQKRCKAREVTISATSISDSSSSPSSLSHQPHRKLDSPSVVSPDSYWCCPASKATPTLSPPPSLISPLPRRSIIPPHFCQRTDLPPFYTSDSSGNSRIQLTPRYFSPDMDFSSAVPASNAHSGLQNESFPSSFTKFNSALTAGLLNPMSPPPPPQENVRSPTLFTLMANEPDIHPRSQIPSQTIAVSGLRALLPPQDKQSLMMQRISNLLGSRSPGNQFNDTSNSDIKLTLSSKDGISVSMNVHRQILVAHSRFFSVKLSDRWAKQQRSTPYIVEIADCDDVEIYIETLKLLYCRDIKKKLMMEDVPRILGILKVSAAIGFDAGVLSCLEYLEAAPWAEDEEEKVASLLSELHLEGAGAGEVLKRVSVEFNNGPDEGSDNEEVLLKLLHVVLEGKDEKARREMKGLLLKMLRESSSSNDLRKESLYSAFERCLKLLRQHFLQAANSELQEVSQIARQADNLSWILDIMIDRQIAEDFLRTWAAQSDLSEVHSKVPVVHRFEISRVTSRLFVGIGRGQLLAPKDVRFMLLQTWLVPFYNDFGWMRRASKGIDRHLVEEGLSNTILTLPLAWQQDILLAWFDRFMNSGEDCPNIQRGFEVWWRRAFWRRHGEQERPHPLRVMASSVDNTL